MDCRIHCNGRYCHRRDPLSADSLACSDHRRNLCHLQRHQKTVHTDSVAAVFAETLVLAPFALALLVWMETQGTGAIGLLHGWQWVLIPLAGVVTTVPLMLFSAGIQTTSMTLAGILTYVSPTLQLLISVLLYQEEFTTTHAILFGFVWSGLALYMISGYLQDRKCRQEDKLCE